MAKRGDRILSLLLLSVLLLACAPINPFTVPTQIPGAVDTAVAMTAAEAARQTQAALPTSTPFVPSATPTNTPTITPTPTATVIFILDTPTPLVTDTPTPLPTLPVPTSWPDWSEGAVFEFPPGSSENTGTNKYFVILNHLKVVVTRPNGIKLRGAPSKASGGKLKAEEGEFLVLIGYWNMNENYSPVWTFVKVVTSNGNQYWVGGGVGEDTDPQLSLRFVGRESPETATPVETP
jgi:hypothetical protein